MKVKLFGVGGKVGSVLAPALEAAGHELVELEAAEATIDFTAPDAVVGHIESALDAGVPCIVGTSGWEPAVVEAKALEAGLPVFYAPNFAIGAVLMMRFAAEAARHVPRAEIVEVAEGRLRTGELERAKENLKGRILLSMESTSNRMSRLGKSLVSDTELLSIDRIAAEIDAVTPDAVAELAGVLLAPDKLSASGIGPSEERFRDAVRRITPELPARAAA